MKRPAANRPSAVADGTPRDPPSSTTRRYHRRMSVNLQQPWSIGGVEVPTRIVLAPMAGVSIQAFRRQGRRFGAGLVCSEMVSAAGIEHKNERTFGYLRVAADEHPLAIQIFGAEPAAMAEAAQMYTGVADHALTAELVERVSVPVIASGDVTTRGEAIAVLERTGAAAAMVARGAQGNPWALRAMIEGEAFAPTREEVAAELI